MIASVSIELPDIVGERAAENILVLREQTTIPLEPQQWLGLDSSPVAASEGLDGWLRYAWIALSLLMLAVLLVHGVQLYRR